MTTKVLALMKQLTNAGDYAGVEQQARAFLNSGYELPTDQVAVLLHWSYSAGMSELHARGQKVGDGPSALELALQALELARANLSESDRQRASAEYQAAMQLHSARRNGEAWECVKAAYEFWRPLGRVETALASLYVEVAMGCGKAELALAPAKELVDYEKGRSWPTTLILAMWLYGRCLASAGNIAEARKQLQATLDLAVKERGDPSILAEFQAAIDALNEPRGPS